MIRTATVHDVAEIRAMIRELAAYEKAAEQARATEEQLRAALFGEHPAASVLIAEDDATGAVAGFALWFPRFSTWTGTRGMHLEDLYVRPHTRGAGHGGRCVSSRRPGDRPAERLSTSRPSTVGGFRSRIYRR
ncbi:hypothetical protein SGRIM128S_00336 [Streptomyces griseomycini]